VYAQIARFFHSGYREVVLTGIHLGQWGKDLPGNPDLCSLLYMLHQKGSLPDRVRLSSIEPKEWEGGLMRRLGSWQRICPHFHVPLQSGAREILLRMHRPYSPQLYGDLIWELHRRFPRAALGADILVGFPGETETHFQQSVQLIESLPLSYLHVFPYSPRTGTPAASWPGRVNGTDLKHRAQKLRAIDFRMREIFRRQCLGHWVEVLAETEVEPGWWQGTSDNYVQVRFQGPPTLPRGSLVRVRLDRVSHGVVWGEVDSIRL
jgi:threonylcarbamoyladenosine tRNA methylthiotransferase MtaB